VELHARKQKAAEQEGGSAAGDPHWWIGAPSEAFAQKTTSLVGGLPAILRIDLRLDAAAQ